MPQKNIRRGQGPPRTAYLPYPELVEVGPRRDPWKIEDSNDGKDGKGKRIIRANKARKFFDMGRGKK